MFSQSKLFTCTAVILLLCLLPAYCSMNPIPAPTARPAEALPDTAPAPIPATEPSPPPDAAPSPTPVPDAVAIPISAQEQQTPAESKQTQPPGVQPPQIQPGTASDVNSIPEEVRVNEEKALEFKANVEAIVMKHLKSFYKNGGKGIIGIYIRELSTGFEYGCNDEMTNPEDPTEGYFKTASTCKLMSAAVIYYLNNIGELKLDEYLTDKVTGSRYCLKQLVPRMISHSVNGYFNITLRQLGSSKINDTLKKLGIQKSAVFSEIMPASGASISANIKRYGISKSPRTTPRDLGQILVMLHEGKIMGEANSKALADALKSNIYSNRLPQGIGYKSSVGHKTGTSSGEGVYNDAGIIYLEGNPYIMVVMSKDSNSGVQSVYRSMAAELYEYMKHRVK